MQHESLPVTTQAEEIPLHNLIVIDPAEKYQVMDGFGGAMTGSACYNLLKMDAGDRSKLLKETFDPENGDGYSFIRISIGCSDFSLDEYTYCDIPGIEHFEMHEYDKRDLFPILREIRTVNPDVKILASPWTCPKWMKVNNLKDLKPYDSWTSGQLNPECYADYATYFVKYIREMEKEGFTIDAITIQNEPLNRGNSASLYMTWQEQRDFIKEALGPAFARENIKTKIIIYDHNYNYDMNKPENADQGQYPLKIYEDPEAARYIDGAAYHAYGGNKNELYGIREARPDKNLYFTEMSIGLWGSGYDFGEDLMWNMREVCLGTINNFNKAVIMWNYLLDDKHGPDRPGGCNICLGMIDIDSKDYKTLTRNSHYYTMAHLSKVIKPGAYRIKCVARNTEEIYFSAFENPDKSYALVVQNDKDAVETVTVNIEGKVFTHELAPRSVNSYRWKTGTNNEPDEKM
jgi:O-Glycosyl hydrolase